MKFIKKVKENLKDPKKKSLTLLGIYFIFFIVVFALISSAPKIPDIENYEDETSFDTIDSYEYTYKITNNTNLIEINGTHKESEDLFTYNNKKYYKKDNTLNLYENEKLTEIKEMNFDIDKYNYKTIEDIINSSEKIEETVYKDESNKTTYNINIIKYLDLVKEKNICKSDCSNISIPIVVNFNKYINSIKIDLTEYYKYKYIIEINYYNINNIEEIKISTKSS